MTFTRLEGDDGDGLLSAAGGQAQLTGVLVRHAVRAADLSRVVGHVTRLFAHALRLSSSFTAIGAKLTRQVRTGLGNGARDRFCDPEGDG